MYYVQNFHSLCNAHKLHYILVNSEKKSQPTTKPHHGAVNEKKFGQKNAWVSYFWADKCAITGFLEGNDTKYILIVTLSAWYKIRHYLKTETLYMNGKQTYLFSSC